MNKKFAIRTGLIAALQCALIVVLAPLSFGPFQFRVSNLMNIFPFIFGLPGAVGVCLGGFIANFFAPYGIADVVIGGLFSGITVLGLIYWFGKQAKKTKKEQPWLTFALITSPILTTFWIGAVLLHRVYEVPLVPLIPYFVLEELLTSAIGGYFVYKALKRFQVSEK